MVGENFEICYSEMSKYADFRRNISTMVGENFEIHSSKMSKYAVFRCNPSAMVGENFENILKITGNQENQKKKNRKSGKPAHV